MAKHVLSAGARADALCVSMAKHLCGRALAVAKAHKHRWLVSEFIGGAYIVVTSQLYRKGGFTWHQQLMLRSEAVRIPRIAEQLRSAPTLKGYVDLRMENPDVGDSRSSEFVPQKILTIIPSSREHSMDSGALQGLRGDVFEVGGRIAGAIPPSGQPNAIPFQIKCVWPATNKSPAWADMVLGKDILARINPDICKPPFFRLFDCVKGVETQAAQIRALKKGVMFSVTLQGTTFVFWPEIIGESEVIMIDYEDRVRSWNPQVSDG